MILKSLAGGSICPDAMEKRGRWASQSSSLSQRNTEIIGSRRVQTTMKKIFRPELGVHFSLPFLTKILPALGSEQHLDLDLIRWKEGSGLSLPSSATLHEAFPSSDFYFPFPPFPGFCRERRSVAAGLELGSWSLSCSTWMDDGAFEKGNMKGLLYCWQATAWWFLLQAIPLKSMRLESV